MRSPLNEISKVAGYMRHYLELRAYNFSVMKPLEWNNWWCDFHNCREDVVTHRGCFGKEFYERFPNWPA